MKPENKVILEELFTNYPQLDECKESIEQGISLLIACYSKGGKVLVCGNGGSASDSEHIVGELMKGFLLKRKIKDMDKEKIIKAYPEEGDCLSNGLQGALQAISLVSQSSLSTAYINDVSSDMMYAQQVYGYGNEGDVLIGLSTSGNSKNVVNAIKIAKAFGMKAIGCTGENGGIMKEICDVTIMVPAVETYRVQEYHLPVYHALCAVVEAEFFEE